jgi:hypothetical protein
LTPQKRGLFFPSHREATYEAVPAGGLFHLEANLIVA